MIYNDRLLCYNAIYFYFHIFYLIKKHGYDVISFVRPSYIFLRIRSFRNCFYSGNDSGETKASYDFSVVLAVHVNSFLRKRKYGRIKIKRRIEIMNEYFLFTRYSLAIKKKKRVYSLNLPLQASTNRRCNFSFYSINFFQIQINQEKRNIVTQYCKKIFTMILRASFVQQK